MSTALIIALGAGGTLTVLARAVPDSLLRHKNVTIEITGPGGEIRDDLRDGRPRPACCPRPPG
ncbi:hypothetical protein ACWEKR_23675 [Nocardia sp. NPDC004573]